MEIVFDYLGVNKRFRIKAEFKRILGTIVKDENKKLGKINFIFTSNSKIGEINREFLNHNYFTDVITFNANRKNCIGGDIFISVDQVIINADKYLTSFQEELKRVIVHGMLHLVGYDDKTEEERKVMRDKEDIYLCRMTDFNFIEK